MAVPALGIGCACTAEIPASKHTITRHTQATAQRPFCQRVQWFLGKNNWDR
jgi:hypothetical protein